MSNTLIHRFSRAVLRHWSLRDGARRLERLDDRMLADIGISRSEIHGAVRGRRSR
jgi:uncharacterized protein YjiS (DUF1127 family)